MRNHRKPRPLYRDESTLRDTRLFIVATEDTYAPDQYLSQFKLSRVQIKVLPTLDKNSSAKDVLKRLKDYRNRYDLDEDDLLWILLDTDHFTQGTHLQKYTSAIQEARQSNIQVLISNPCFDLWFLLHHDSGKMLVQGDRCSVVGEHLKKILGSFNKKKINLQNFGLERLPDAMKVAQDLNHSSERIPQLPQTQFPQLILEILKYSPVSQLPESLKSFAQSIK